MSLRAVAGPVEVAAAVGRKPTLWMVPLPTAADLGLLRAVAALVAAVQVQAVMLAHAEVVQKLLALPAGAAEVYAAAVAQALLVLVPAEELAYEADVLLTGDAEVQAVALAAQSVLMVAVAAVVVAVRSQLLLLAAVKPVG